MPIHWKFTKISQEKYAAHCVILDLLKNQAFDMLDQVLDFGVGPMPPPLSEGVGDGMQVYFETT